MEREGGDLNELAFELTGDLGQAFARLTGRVCRERYTGIEPWRAEQYISMERRTAKRALGVTNELGWDTEKPANIHALLESIDGDEIIEIVERHYQAHYGSSADKNSQHNGFGDSKCPFEDSQGMQTACFSCPARKQMVEELNEKAAEERGRTQE